jgi:hypothetical protein
MSTSRSRRYTVNPWKTLRQRRGRARKGQVSAIATIFGLLLVVTFISNFILLQLPGEEASNEYAHVLLVENQLATLQGVLFAQSRVAAGPYTLTAPVSLGAQGVPPFGEASGSTLYLQNDSYLANLTLPQISMTFYSGVGVQINNVYSPQAHVVLEQGAVVFQQGDAGVPIMLEDPDFFFNGSGPSQTAGLTLFSLVGNDVYQSGLTTAMVGTQILSTNSFNVTAPPGTTSGAWFNVTTAYPQAWASYFSSLSNAGDIAAGPTCTEVYNGVTFPVNCGNNILGVTTVSIEFAALTYHIHQEMVSVSFE